MKEKLKNAFLILLGVGLLLYLFITGIMDLVNTKDVKNVNISEAATLLELEHSINGLIPIGTDYYYLGIDNEGNGYLLKGSKKWLSKNFGADYSSYDADGVEVKGLVKKIGDYQTEREIESRLSEIDETVFPYGKLGCLNMNYMLVAILKIIDGLLFVFIVASVIIVNKGEGLKNIGDSNPVFGKIWVACLLVALALMIWIIR